MNPTHQTVPESPDFADERCPTPRIALLFLSLLLAACRDSKVDAYRVPKEKDANFPATAVASAPAPAPAAAPAAANAGSDLTWTAPAGWQSKPLGAMRKGSYAITGAAGASADVSITAFPGAVGGELANINRWRGQLGLPPIVASDLAASVTRLSQNGLTFTLVDLASTGAASPRRVLGAMAPYGDAMWFFKLSGPGASVATAKRAFIEFLTTVKLVAPAAP
jgi:hypothetical protein